ncbi:MAG TPA: acetyl-CoA carboxylase carboxyltransferase subunit beta, partial [Thermoanaerobaculia bacterium]|nr:acetyl-CoA carboxylase carboxyltransferase subunit beta [Thermoanaerobaculia bacterium]
MPWFKKAKKPKPVRRDQRRSTVPEGLWVKCEGCKEVIYSKELDRNLRICPKCGYHFRIGARERIALLLDEEDPKELGSQISPTDPLDFKDSKRYKDRLKLYQERVGERDAVIVVEGHLDGVAVVMAVMEYRFMGGSMGSVVGEKIARAAEQALKRNRPLVVVSA